VRTAMKRARTRVTRCDIRSPDRATGTPQAAVVERCHRKNESATRPPTWASPRVHNSRRHVGRPDWTSGGAPRDVHTPDPPSCGHEDSPHGRAHVQRQIRTRTRRRQRPAQRRLGQHEDKDGDRSQRYAHAHAYNTNCLGPALQALTYWPPCRLNGGPDDGLS
jgi:hypothetical protein